MNPWNPTCGPGLLQRRSALVYDELRSKSATRNPSSVTANTFRL